MRRLDLRVPALHVGRRLAQDLASHRRRPDEQELDEVLGEEEVVANGVAARRPGQRDSRHRRGESGEGVRRRPTHDVLQTVSDGGGNVQGFLESATGGDTQHLVHVLE